MKPYPLVELNHLTVPVPFAPDMATTAVRKDLSKEGTTLKVFPEGKLRGLDLRNKIELRDADLTNKAIEGFVVEPPFLLLSSRLVSRNPDNEETPN